MKDKNFKNLILYIILFVIIIIYGIVRYNSSSIPTDISDKDCLTFVKTDGVFIDNGEVVVYNDFDISGISKKTDKVRFVSEKKGLKTYMLQLNNGESITVYGANLKEVTDKTILEDGAHSIMCFVNITRTGDSYTYQVDYERTKQQDESAFQWLLKNDTLFKYNFFNEAHTIWI